MSNTTRVKLAFDLIRHSSFEDAAASGVASAARGLHLVNGVVLSSYQFDGELLILSFRNNHDVIISIDAERIVWRVEQSTGTEIGLARSNLTFELPNGDCFDWNWKNVLSEFIGRKIYLHPGNQLLFNNVPGIGEFVVMAYVGVQSASQKYMDISEA
jgi:hypothetical protein